MTQSRVTCWSSTSLNTQFLINKSRGWLGVTWDRQILNLDIVLPHDWRCRHNQIPRRHTTSTSDHVTLSLANIWAEKLSSLGKNVCTESNEEASDDDKTRYQVHVCTVVTAASAVLPDLSLTSPISALTDWLLTYWPLQLLARCQHVRRPGREREWESTCVVWCGVVWCGAYNMNDDLSHHSLRYWLGTPSQPTVTNTNTYICYLCLNLGPNLLKIIQHTIQYVPGGGGDQSQGGGGWEAVYISGLALCWSDNILQLDMRVYESLLECKLFVCSWVDFNWV